MKNKRMLFLLFLVLFLSLLVGFTMMSAVAEAAPKYTFWFVSHIGPADPNMLWLTKAIEDFEKRYPEVSIKYVAPEEFSVKKQLEYLETAIAAKPDGLIVPITDPTALEDTLKRAIAAGIPVIASNIEDPRKPPEKIPYLTYVGGDEYQTGYQLGERLLKEITPKHVLIAIPHVGHVGAEMRAKGMTAAVTPVGAKVEKLAIGDEASHAIETLTAYLLGNPDVDAIFTTAMLASTWIYSVMEDLGRTDIKLIGVDESPCSLEGIISGKMLATHSQGFYLQGYLPPEWLYFYLEYGFVPPPTVLVGPIIIDKSNVESFKKLVLSVFGQKTYEELTLW